MSEEKKDLTTDKAKDFTDKIKELKQEMVLYSNPSEIEKTASLIKKNVSLFSRSNFSAYLLIKLLSKNERNTPSSDKRGQDKQQNFGFHINLGRIQSNHNELSAFVCKNAGLNSSEISHITLKDNYSFVYLTSNKIETVTKKLNGLSYGKKKVKASAIR